MHQARRDAEPRRRGFERGKQLPGYCYSVWQPHEAICCPIYLEQSRRQPPEPGRRSGNTAPWRPSGAIIDVHRFPFLRGFATGKSSPVAGKIVSGCRLSLSCLDCVCLRLVLDGFTRREFGEAPPWQAGRRFLEFVSGRSGRLAKGVLEFRCKFASATSSKLGHQVAPGENCAVVPA